MTLVSMSTRLLAHPAHRGGRFSQRLVHTLYLSLIILHAVSTSHAADWYVDLSATGAENGASWTDAWTDMPKVVWGEKGVKAGDTLYISGGVVSKTYTNVWITSGSGTAQSPITIRVGQDSGHNGHVIFDGTGLGNTFDSPMGFGRLNGHHYVLDGSVSGERRMTFVNILNTNSIRRTSASAVLASGTGGHRISFITASNVNNGIKLSSATNTVVHSCWVQARGDGAIVLNNSRAMGYDEHLVYSNNIIVMWFPGQGGPDGIQANDGLTAFNNTFDIVRWYENTSGQHPDYIQCPGRWMKVYGNDFHNVGDSAIDKDPHKAGAAIEDVLIYNNIFRITQDFDTYPGQIRLYNTGGNGVTYFQNVRILNNTFIDNTARSISVLSASFESVGGGTNNIIANNMFVNCGAANSSLIRIMGTRPGFEGIEPSQWEIVHNLFYNENPNHARITWQGNTYTATEWKASVEASTLTESPVFVRYSPRATNNDLRLSGADTSPRGAGVRFSGLFSTDYDGRERGDKWDLGAFQFLEERSLTADNDLLVWLTFEDDFAGAEYIQDWSGWGNHAWRFGRPNYPTNWPKQTSASISPGGLVGMGYAGDFYWYNDGWGAFGRSGDYAAITNSAALLNMTTATIALWGRHFSAARVGADSWAATQNATLVSAGTSTGTLGSWDLGRFSMQNVDNNVRFLVLTNASFEGGNNGRYAVEFPDKSNGFLSWGDTTNWNHYAVTWDRGRVRGYFNGGLISDASLHVDALTIGKNPTNPTHWIGLGCNTHGGTPPLEDEPGEDYPNHGWWNGLIDDVRIYRRVLSAGEIMSIAGGQPSKDTFLSAPRNLRLAAER